MKQDPLAPDAPVAVDPDAPPVTPDAPVVPIVCEPTVMRTDLAWFGANRGTLEGWLDSQGCASPGYDPEKKPIALFDWDNTVTKNDVGDAITFYAIKNAKVVQPPNQDWKLTSQFMTDAASTALTAACGTTIAAGASLQTDTNLACADEMLSIYIDGKTIGGAAAFAGFNYRRIEPTYAWTAQLLAGNTHAEVAAFGLAAVMPMLSNPEGTVQTVGTRTNLNAYIRIYPQTQDVINAVKSRGYDVWVITASPQDLVGALAPMTGIPTDHVIGIRSKTDANGKLTYRFEGCGPVADGEASMITYIEGKRCWVNKIIHGDTTANAINRRPVGERFAFGAGDSDTDIEFLRDSDYKLVLNRGKKEIMCFAYHNEGGSWLANPMFIQPRPMQATPYACSTTACKSVDGVGSPCLDDSGAIIPDQVDSRF